MKRPENFAVGEQLRAARLNEVIDYARGPVTTSFGGQTAGVTGSRVFNASLTMARYTHMLVQATEDFALSVTDNTIADDVPSGICRMVRMDRSANVYATSEITDRVYDTITGLMGGEAPVTGDYMYCMFSTESGRWEKIGSAEFTVVHGIPRQCLNDGWYLVELATFNAEPQQASDFVSLGEDCSLCDTDFGGASDTDSCLTVTEVDRNFTKPTGLGVFAYGHDADGLPLKLNGHVKMVARSAGVLGESGSASYSGSGSNSASDTQNVLYDILSGTRPMIRFPAKEVWTCCADGSVVLTECTSAIVYGIACDPVIDVCP